MVAATIPAVYASALLAAADEAGVREAVIEDVGSIAEALRSDPDIIGFIDGPLMTREHAKQTVQKCFAGCQELVLNFLCLLIDRSRFSQVLVIVDEVASQVDQQAGVEHVTITSAATLMPDQFTALAASLGAALGEGVVITTDVDKTLIGGVKVQIGDRVLDGSIARQLATVKQAMLATPLPAGLWESNEGETA